MNRQIRATRTMALRREAFLMGSKPRWLPAPLFAALLPLCVLCSSCAQRGPAEPEPSRSEPSSVSETPPVSAAPISAVSPGVAKRPSRALASDAAPKSDPSPSQSTPRLSAGVTASIDPVSHRFVPGPAPLGSSNTSSAGLVQTPAITGGAFVRLNGHFQNQVTATVSGLGQAPVLVHGLPSSFAKLTPTLGRRT